MKITPLGEEAGQRLTLREQDGRHDLLLGNVVLLSSAALGTERAFGRLARLGAMDEAEPGAVRVLVGGLGFGSTVRGVLDELGDRANVIVAEKLRTVEGLVRTSLSHLSGDVLSDPRVTLVTADVSDVLREETGLSAILLDVDNGPNWASFRSNARIYSPSGLEAARSALVSGGVYCVWSGYPADQFIPQLRKAGFTPTVEPLHENGRLAARAYVGRK